MLCQCGFIESKGTSLVGDADNGGGCAYVGTGGIGEFIYLSLNFAVN